MKLVRQIQKKYLGSESGFTLMEMMVAVGIGGIVTLGVSYMMENAARLKIESERGLEKAQLEFVFDSVFINPEDCSESIIAGSSAPPPPIATPNPEILAVDIGTPESDPVPAGRIYTTDLTGASTIALGSLRTWGSNGVKVALDLSTLPLRIGRSHISITSATMGNLKVTKTIEVPDPANIGADFVNSGRISVPVAGTIDVVVGMTYKKMGGGASGTVLVDKDYNVVKTVPVALSIERPANVMSDKVYISGCRSGDDASLYDIERYVCDNMAGGPRSRKYGAVNRWGNTGSYVECKDIVNVRKRLLEMEMCIEVGGSWNGTTKSCFNPSPIKSLSCPGTESSSASTKLVVFGIYPDAAAPDGTESLPSPPGDGVTEKIECKLPCPTTVVPPGTECPL